MILARFLPDADRDAVLGDLAESHASRCAAFREILLLLLRRQRANWTWIVVYSGFIAWQFFVASNNNGYADGHADHWFAVGCASFAFQNLMIAGTLWRSGRAIWLNALLASAVELGATLYLNLTMMHGSRPFALRIELVIVLGPALLLVAGCFQDRVLPYIARCSPKRRRSGS
jgi:hypothetical protein